MKKARIEKIRPKCSKTCSSRMRKVPYGAGIAD